MKKVLVYLEAKDNQLKRSSYELVTAAKDFSSKTGCAVVGLLIGGSADQAKSAGEYGLTEILHAQDASFAEFTSTGYAKAIAQAAKDNSCDTVIFSANSTGLELAPRVAVKLSAGYVADCVAFEFDGANPVASKPVYAGKAQIRAKVNTENKVFSLRPNVFTAVKSPAGAEVKPYAVAIGADDKKAVVKSVSTNAGKLDVAEADIIVSGGRGIKGPENYHLIENLASKLGAAVGASRAVVDAGWRPHSEQVGQTGKTVSPSMYVACGISGAIQHLAGMSGSKLIVAVNKDKDAPIMKVADYAIIGDLFDVLPKLTEKIGAVTGK